MKRKWLFRLKDFFTDHPIDFCYNVSWVIDGDTFMLESGEKVRLIGIDSPERGAEFYKEAKDKLEELIGNEWVRLVKDESEVDQYGRLLRYVYFHSLFVNLEMVKSGYARAVRYPHDTKYADLFEQAEFEAKDKGLGFWELGIFPRGNSRWYPRRYGNTTS